MQKIAFVACVHCVLTMTWAAHAADHPTDRISNALQLFSTTWTTDAWVPRSRSGRSGYLRPDDDRGWKARFLAFQTLITAGDDALPKLRHLLQQGTLPQRILAAQTLSLSPIGNCRAELTAAARSDPDPAVRLYAIDALSIHQGQSQQRLFKELAKTEKNRDVKRHLAYALERHGKTLANAANAVLRAWNPKRLDTAHVGRRAPDFELPSITGRKYRLSDYRDKASVVLVFVYGDT